MLGRYDGPQNAWVDGEFARRFDGPQNAWVDCEFARTYDGTQGAWVDKLRKLMEVSVSSGFYKNSGNIIFAADETLHCEVKPTNEEILIEFKLEESFTNPQITLKYSFGYSDLCPNIASGFRSHGCVEWWVKGYVNGAEAASQHVASGSNYAYETVFDEEVQTALAGTFDEIRLVCKVISFTNYTDYNRANTTIENFAIDGKEYSAKAQSITS